MSETFYPNVFNASIGSYTGNSYQVVWKDGQLCYKAFGYGYKLKRTQSKEPGPADWQEFWDELDRIGMWDWEKTNYSKAGIVDGAVWSVEIGYNKRELKTGDSNAYPSQFEAFLKAVQKLTGGREFQ